MTTTPTARYRGHRDGRTQRYPMQFLLDELLSGDPDLFETPEASSATALSCTSPTDAALRLLEYVTD